MIARYLLQAIWYLSLLIYPIGLFIIVSSPPGIAILPVSAGLFITVLLHFVGYFLLAE